MTGPKKPTWNEYFLEIAHTVSIRSSCVRRRVGAVVVKDNRIVGTGYNDSPAGTPGCESCPRRLSTVAPGSSYDTGAGACVALHAEMNSILYCDREDVIDSTVFITTDPCEGCQKMMRGAGVIRVVWPDGELNFERKAIP